MLLSPLVTTPATAATPVAPLAKMAPAAKMSPATTKKKPKITASAIKKMRLAWGSYGVSKKTQDKLIKKLKAGRPWDSLKTSTAKSIRKYTGNGYIRRIYTYADGSIRVTSMTQPTSRPPFNPLSFRGQTVAACTVREDHYSYSATGCVASVNYIALIASVVIDYGAASGSGNASITDAYDGKVLSFLGAADWKDPRQISGTEWHMVFSTTLVGTITAPQVLTVRSTSSHTVEAFSR